MEMASLKNVVGLLSAKDRNQGNNLNAKQL